jgi:hypothetical protein
MQLTVLFNEEIANMEVSDEMNLEDFLAFVVVEIPALESVPRDRYAFLHNQRKILLNTENLVKSLRVCL